MNPNPLGATTPAGGILRDPLKKELIPRLNGAPQPPDCWTKLMLEHLKLFGDIHSAVNWSLEDNDFLIYLGRAIRNYLSPLVESALTEEDCLFEIQRLRDGGGSTCFPSNLDE